MSRTAGRGHACGSIYLTALRHRLSYDRNAVPLYDPAHPPERSDGSDSELRAPSLLIAMPQVLDPFFHKSVVLLIHQDEDGSFGLILNRKTALTLGEVLEGLEIGWGGDAEAQAFFGGPVQPQIGTVLFPTAGESRVGDLDATAECAPGIALTHHVSDLGKLALHPPSGLRLFLGYAGWGAGQLVQEILRDDWLIAPVRGELVFAPDPDGVWEAALASVGIDPATLPSWSTRGEDGGDRQAN